jgi:hypothetical protein
MPLKDSLLDCLNAVAIALEKELLEHHHVYTYEDVNLGKRAVCSICGRTFYPWFGEIRHSEWCKLGQNLELIKRAKQYTQVLDGLDFTNK